MLKLSLAQWLTILATLGGACIGVFGYFLINEWYKPDLRYEEGGYYRSGEEAVTSLKLQNYGEREAKSIRITATFPKELAQDVTTSNNAYRFKTEEGGKGETGVVGTIERLAPDQKLEVFFTINNPKGLLVPKSSGYIESITYEGGKAKTGQPIFYKIILPLLVNIAIVVVMLIVGYVIPSHKVRREYAKSLEDLNEAARKNVEKIQSMIDSRDVQMKQLEREVAAEIEGTEKLTKLVKDLEPLVKEKLLQYKKERDEAIQKSEQLEGKLGELMSQRTDESQEPKEKTTGKRSKH